MSDPIGTNDEFMRAADLIHTNPLAITDYQLKVLRSTHPHFAEQAGRARAEAISKAALDEERRTQEATEARARQAQALPPIAKAAFLNDDESPEAWWTRNMMKLAPVWLVRSVNDTIQAVLVQMNQNNAS